MPRSYPPELGRMSSFVLKAGRCVAQIASGLRIFWPSIYFWCRRNQADARILSRFDHRSRMGGTYRVAFVVCLFESLGLRWRFP